MQSVSIVVPFVVKPLIWCRYKPDLKLRFITEELGFESDEESARFICDHGGEAFLEEQAGDIRLFTSKSLPVFEAARKAAFHKVDIKGPQI